MKNIRSIIAVVFATTLLVSFVHAGGEKADQACKCSADKACCCVKDKEKDAKDCGKDKPCCCSAKEDKKPAEKK